MNDYEKGFEEKSSFQRFCEMTSVLVIIGITIYTLTVWKLLPDEIATHFNAKGEADGFGSKITVWMMIVFMIVLNGILYLSTKFPKLMNYPVRINEDNKEIQYQLAASLLRIMMLEMTAFFAAIQLGIIQGALNGRFQLNIMVTIGFVVLLLATSVVYIVLAIKNK